MAKRSTVGTYRLTFDVALRERSQYHEMVRRMRRAINEVGDTFPGGIIVDTLSVQEVDEEESNNG